MLVFISSSLVTIISIGSLQVSVFSVLLSFSLNLLVVIVIMLRPKKKNSIDIFVIALASSDILFSVAIHPMLVATSFGANVEVLFGHAGIGIVFEIIIYLMFQDAIGLDLGLFSLAVSVWSSMAASVLSGRATKIISEKYC